MAQHTTRKNQIFADKLATIVITAVGLGVIVAVAGMMLFLFNTVAPLGKSEKLENAILAGTTQGHFALSIDHTTPLKIALVESTAAAPSPSCAADLFLLGATPQILSRFFLVPSPDTPGKYQLSFTPPAANAQRCVGMSNSEVLILNPAAEGKPASATRVGLEFSREFLTEEDALALQPELVRELNAETFSVQGKKVYTRNSSTAPIALVAPSLASLENFQFAVQPSFFETEALQQAKIEITNADNRTGLLLVRNRQGGLLNAHVFMSKENAIAGTVETSTAPLNLEDIRNALQPQSPESPKSRASANPPVPLSIVGMSLVAGTEIWTFFSDGRVSRSLLPAIPPAPVEAQSGTPANSPTQPPQPTAHSLLRIQGVGQLLNTVKTFGGSVVLFDDGLGRCGAVDAGRISRIRRLDNPQPLGANLLEEQPLWETSCAKSTWSRLVANPHMRLVMRLSDAGVEAFETTTGRSAFDYSSSEFLDLAGASALAPAVKPELTTLGFARSGASALVQIADQVFVFPIFAPHLEASREAFFERVHYEGYEEASFSWQSTSGTDDFQAKYSLIPLMWGTFKATFYALVFAVPLGILASVYSSEILDRKTRNIIKPSIEMMASLPSVVLGFLAAIVIAPWVENHVVSVMVIGLAMPFVLYLAGNLLSTLSAKQISARGLYASRRLLMWLIGGVVLSLTILIRLGTLIERTAFGGDIKTYLAGGPGIEGVLWGILLLPATFILLWSIPMRRAVKTYRTVAFLLGPVVAFAGGYFVSHLSGLNAQMFGTYSQRNTLVIAIAMGFAIIPIIYSLAEDALTAVPASLRAASLACGASVWQTTARVVLPTAASGIFSAIMVGLGRGIGETMIVVMATGNSAVMTSSPFDGLRSLAANIAVELPEAAQGSTHYRVLFLSGLILFAFTFLLNSFAEILRTKYRERNKAL